MLGRTCFPDQGPEGLASTRLAAVLPSVWGGHRHPTLRHCRVGSQPDLTPLPTPGPVEGREPGPGALGWERGTLLHPIQPHSQSKLKDKIIRRFKAGTAEH